MKSVYLAVSFLLAGLVGGWAVRSLLIFPLDTLSDPIVTVPEGYSSVPLPSTLFIRGERWKIYATTFTGDTVGLTECDRKIIWYVRDKQASELRDTMWHEVIHAANCKFEKDQLANWKQYSKDSPTHDTVYTMASFLEEFVMSNPDFVRWAMDR